MSNSAFEMGFTAARFELEETLWSMTQRSRALQELRADLRQVWDDEATREINGRYLDPHEQDGGKFAVALANQGTCLDEVARQLDAANVYAARIDECAAVITEKLRFAEQDLDNSYGNYDYFMQCNAEARSRVSVVHELISRANASCS
jgi:hypothetical protein